MTNQVTSIVPVLLAGGSGTRLWPLSRAGLPKQLLPLGGDEQSMLQSTLGRTSGEEFESPVVLTSKALAELVAQQLADVGIEPDTVVVEPEPKNTAAAVALAALHVAKRSPSSLILVMPSDHAISDPAAFWTAVSAARVPAARGWLTTFGISANTPETGYGYIKVGTRMEHADGVHHVVRFIEKPDHETALSYLEAGNYVWNSGIFLFRADTYLEALKVHAPLIYAAARDALVNAVSEPPFLHPNSAAFAKAPAVSIDYAVMEHESKVAVVPVDMGWSDVGSWEAVWQLAQRSAADSALQGDILDLGSRGCLLRAEPGMHIVAIGIEDLVAVATRDAVLLMPRSRAQDLGQVVQQVKAWKAHLT